MTHDIAKDYYGDGANSSMMRRAVVRTCMQLLAAVAAPNHLLPPGASALGQRIATACLKSDDTASAGWACPTQCMHPNGSRSACGPGNEMCGRAFGPGYPQFHIRDRSCGNNDPNAPFFDPVHGFYHLFFQNHLSEPEEGWSGFAKGNNVVWGHVFSRDLVRWAHLPVPMWNDGPFDRLALFSGSATIVDGRVVVIYPGLCNSTSNEWPSCTCLPNNHYCRNDTTNHYAHNMIAATPANLSDPTYARWNKRVLINNTDADYSAAWRTPSHEWRITGASGLVYGSENFRTWYEIGVQPGFTSGACPSFFALPRVTPGAGPAPAGARQYNFVHKISHHGDWMQVGHYDANAPMTNGSWLGAEPQLIDAGFKQGELFYASKDTFDPIKGRRINWGWQTGGKDNSKMSLTLAREVTWHPALSQLVFSPLDEQDSLRGQLLATINRTHLEPAQVLSLGSWADSVGNQSEVEVTFAIPIHAARFGIIVMAASDPKTSGTLFFVQYAPESTRNNNKNLTRSIRTVTVGAMPMKSVSSTGAQGVTDTLRLDESDNSISLRVYVDNVFAEAFWQGGRVAMTVKTPPTVEAAMAITSTENVVVERAQAWRVNSIWTSVEAVLRQPSS